MLTTRGMLPASDVDIERAVTADCRKGIADARIRIMVSGEGLGLLDGEKLMRCRLRGRRVSEVAAQNEGRTALRRNSPPKKSNGVLNMTEVLWGKRRRGERLSHVLRRGVFLTTDHTHTATHTQGSLQA